jgi:hypothetical protein
MLSPSDRHARSIGEEEANVKKNQSPAAARAHRSQRRTKDEQIASEWTRKRKGNEGKRDCLTRQTALF